MSQITVLAECTVNAFSTITIELVEADETQPSSSFVGRTSPPYPPPALPRDGGRHRQDIRRCQPDGAWGARGATHQGTAPRLLPQG